MFIQIIRGRVNDAAAIRAATNRWQAELKSDAKGYLGGTSGVADDGTFIAVVRFESEEAARTNSEHHEQRAWWEKMSKLFYSTPQLYDCPTVDVYLGGGTDDAGFVQLEIFTGAKDIDALRAVDKEFEKLAHLRPDLIGVTTAVAADGTVFATNYFTSEAQARDGERKETPTEILAHTRRVAELTEDIEYIDLRDPWLYSNAEQGKP